MSWHWQAHARESSCLGPDAVYEAQKACAHNIAMQGSIKVAVRTKQPRECIPPVGTSCTVSEWEEPPASTRWGTMAHLVTDTVSSLGKLRKYFM